MTYSGIVIKRSKHNFQVDWPNFTYKGYMGMSSGTLHDNGDVTISGIDFYQGQWLRE